MHIWPYLISLALRNPWKVRDGGHMLSVQEMQLAVVAFGLQ